MCIVHVRWEMPKILIQYSLYFICTPQVSYLALPKVPDKLNTFILNEIFPKKLYKQTEITNGHFAVLFIGDKNDAEYTLSKCFQTLKFALTLIYHTNKVTDSELHIHSHTYPSCSTTGNN